MLSNARAVLAHTHSAQAQTSYALSHAIAINTNYVSADALPYLCWEHFCPGEKDELRRRRREHGVCGAARRRGVRQVNRAIESARDMERSASVTYVGHITRKRLRSSCCLPPARRPSLGPVFGETPFAAFGGPAVAAPPAPSPAAGAGRPPFAAFGGPAEARDGKRESRCVGWLWSAQRFALCPTRVECATRFYVCERVPAHNEQSVRTVVVPRAVGKRAARVTAEGSGGVQRT